MIGVLQVQGEDADYHIEREHADDIDPNHAVRRGTGPLDNLA